MRSFKAFSFASCLISTITSVAYAQEDMESDYIAPASISGISGVVKPGQSQDDESVLELAWAFLTEEWWRVAVAAVVLLLVLMLICYLCRCCYLCYDCCTDPFWGCCPKCKGSCCEDCLKLDCCIRRKSRKQQKYYEIDIKDNNLEEGESLTRNGRIAKNNKKAKKPKIVASSNGKEVRNGVGGDGRGGRRRNNNSDQQERQPQMCGTSGDQQQQQQQQQHQNHDETTISFSGKDASGARVSMDKSDIVIEHGRAGRYQPLPEAQSEWVPLQVMRRGPRKTPEESKINNRLSRSMESFGARHLASPTAGTATSTTAGGAGRMGNSNSHADIAVATDPKLFTCHKYSQTDLNEDEPLDFRLQRPVVPMPGSSNSSNSGSIGSSSRVNGRPSTTPRNHNSSSNGSSNGFPLPKAPTSSSNKSAHRNGTRRNGNNNSTNGYNSRDANNPFLSLPRDPTPLSSPLLVQTIPPMLAEKEIVYGGKETNILG